MFKITKEKSNEKYVSVFYEIEEIKNWDNLVSFTNILIGNLKSNELVKSIVECRVQCESGLDMYPLMVFFNDDEHSKVNSDGCFSLDDFEEIFKNNEKIKNEYNDESNPNIEISILLNEEKINISLHLSGECAKGFFMLKLNENEQSKKIIVDTLKLADEKFKNNK